MAQEILYLIIFLVVLYQQSAPTHKLNSFMFPASSHKETLNLVSFLFNVIRKPIYININKSILILINYFFINRKLITR